MISKNRVNLLLVVLATLVTIKSYFAYYWFHQHNLPVYDGIMYERNQILAYLRFHGHFSFMDRVYQAITEFGETNGGFGFLIALINPNWFITDGDIILRSFVAVFFFSFMINKFLEYHVSVINRFILLFSLFQLPMFYNFRIGLTTYVPDITSGLFLISGYLAIYLFIRNHRFRFLLLGMSLVILAIFCRLNFFVYATAIIFPMFLLVYKSIRNERPTTRWLTYTIIVISVSLATYYVSKHIDFFIAYYMKPIEFQKTTLSLSLRSLFEIYLSEISFFGTLLLTAVALLIPKVNLLNRGIALIVLVYPFIFFSTFLIFYLNAVNQPHVFSAFFVCSLPLILWGVKKRNFSYKKPLLYGTILISWIILTIQYFNDLKQYRMSDPNFLVSKKLSNFIALQSRHKKNFNYICFYDEMVDIPIEVSVLNKTGVWLDTKSKFYFNDWNYYDLDQQLNENHISDYYINKLKNEPFDLIAINQEINPKMKKYATAVFVNRKVFEFINRSDLYEKLNISYYSPSEGRVLLFRKKVN